MRASAVSLKEILKTTKKALLREKDRVKHGSQEDGIFYQSLRREWEKIIRLKRELHYLKKSFKKTRRVISKFHSAFLQVPNYDSSLNISIFEEAMINALTVLQSRMNSKE